MSNWTLIYSHGLGGHPWDDPRIDKIKAIANQFDIAMDSISYDETKTVPQLIEMATQYCVDIKVSPENLILVGSSRGAFVASAISQKLYENTGLKIAGLFMLSPAIGIKPHYYPEHFPIPNANAIEVIHPYGDEVVPFQNTVDFCATHHLPLHLVEDSHTLHQQVEFIGGCIENFLRKILSC